MSVRKFYLLQCPASTLVRTYGDCHRHAENVTFALLREYSLSLTSLLELKCALQLPQALLGSRRLLFDLLLLFETNSLTGALKSLCVVFIRVDQRDGLMLYCLFVVIDNASETANN